MITEAIVLAGGLGTRLQTEVPGLPKCLAPVAGKPFLAYLLAYFQRQGISRFVFALGFRSHQVKSFVTEALPASAYEFSIEDEPLGTGGGIYKACSLVKTENVLVLNADSFFSVSVTDFSLFHQTNHALCSIALKPMKDFDRYGIVGTGKEGLVTSFKEKQAVKSGTINAGVYALNAGTFLKRSFPGVFSFEKDFLEKAVAEKVIYGLAFDGYFIDIGIPEDYRRAQTELVAAMLK